MKPQSTLPLEFAGSVPAPIVQYPGTTLRFQFSASYLISSFYHSNTQRGVGGQPSRDCQTSCASTHSDIIKRHVGTRRLA